MFGITYKAESECLFSSLPLDFVSACLGAIQKHGSDLGPEKPLESLQCIQELCGCHVWGSKQCTHQGKVVCKGALYCKISDWLWGIEIFWIYFSQILVRIL
jgi:hypothetical protein